MSEKKKLSEYDKDLFAAQWRWRQRKADPYHDLGRKGFLRNNWGLVVLGGIIMVVIGACLYDK